MNNISELKKILAQHFDFNKARLDCLVQMLVGLFSVCTVNLREIAVGFPDARANVDSRYKRCKRFFSEVKIDYDQLARWVYTIFSLNKKYYLVIDRTNWFWGKSKINILTLGIAYEGVAIPLLWNLLNKAGNATAQEHQGIIERFIRLFGQSQIAGVLADREFASGELFQWFNEKGIPFYIRIKENSLLKIKGKNLYSAAKFFSVLNPKERKVYPMLIELYGQKVFLAGSRSERGELMIVATNQDPECAIYSYLRRWEIECLFGTLKSKGFHLEDTHMTKQERIEKLMALLVMGFVWAHRVGEWRAEQKTIKRNYYLKDKETRPQFSYFLYGLEFIREIILHLSLKWRLFKDIVHQLSPPLPAIQTVISSKTEAIC
jgi:hypothetical protein